MASSGSCVIIGRCADFILRDLDSCFHTFIYADMESRMERCRKRAPEQEHFTDKELRRHIQDVDKRRSKYYQFFTGQTWGEKLNYDLCINTSGANIEDLVKVIAKLVK